MKTHRRARAGRRASGTPATGGPVTANYLYSVPNEEVDINVFATSEKGQLLQAFVSPTPFFSNLGATNLGGGLGPLLAAVQGGTEAWFFGVTEGGHLLSQYWQEYRLERVAGSGHARQFARWARLGAGSDQPDADGCVGVRGHGKRPARAARHRQLGMAGSRDMRNWRRARIQHCRDVSSGGSVFRRGLGDRRHVVVLPYSGGQWGEWSILAHPPGLLIESVSAASGPNALDLVAVAEDGSVWYTYSADGR